MLRDGILVRFGLAVAAGFALLDLARGAATTVTALLTPRDGDDEDFYLGRYGYALTWRIGDRVLTLEEFLKGAIELAIVLLVAWLALRWRARRAE